MLLRLFLVVSLLIVSWPASAALADEIVVDNADPSVQVSGAWSTSSSGDGYAGANYLTAAASNSGGATVLWPVPLGLEPGHYAVYARWTGGSGHASGATYTITFDGGSIDVRKDQRSNGGGWQLLGDFDFRPGQDEGVRLTNNGSDGIVIADAVRWVPAPAPPPLQPRPAPAPSQNAAPAAAAGPTGPVPGPNPTPAPAADSPWTVTLQPIQLHAGPDGSTSTLASVPQFSYLQVLAYQGDWAYVYNPRARGTAYAPSDVLGPSDPPPAWVTAPPPTPTASIERLGRSVGNAPVAYYPVDDKFAYTSQIGHNVPIMVHEAVQGADGSTWYHVDQGYVSANSVRLPAPPSTTYAGRWLDADLREPAMLTAYEGAVPIMSTLAIKGTIANQTPTGVFTIGRRVADETMDSSTIGIPYPGPGGYHLEHVMFTQYFTSDGASIHYNYWSSNWGYAGSHGCLGLPYAESQFLWDWADIGTRVVIRSS
jgi:L,D-transpeptidase catalytic domain